MEPVYEGNPKHKEPWQPGRKGSLCPADIGAERARMLLREAVPLGKTRFAADRGRPFCAQLHDADRNRWHGYPVCWREVPHNVRQAVRDRFGVSNAELKRYW